MSLSLRSTTILLLLFITGCSVDKPKIPRVISTSSVEYSIDDLKDHRSKYETAILSRDEDNARHWRDTMISLIRRDIESFYREYEIKLASSRRDFATGVDVTSLVGVTAATITNGARPKTIISALVSFIQGGHGKIDQNTFRDKTIDVIIQKMRASRTRVDTEILRKMSSLGPRQYTFAEAEKDLRDLFWSGTLLGGFLELAIDAGNDAKDAQREKEEVTDERIIIPRVTPDQRRLASRIREKREALEGAFASNPTSETGKAAVQEAIKAINEIRQKTAVAGTSPQLLSTDANPDDVFLQLRAETEKAIAKPEILPIIAKALGVD